jgi:hypothetical protein
VAPETCNCTSGWNGTSCDEGKQKVTNCLNRLAICSIPCQHGGVCSLPDTCDCTGTGFTGEICNILHKSDLQGKALTYSLYALIGLAVLAFVLVLVAVLSVCTRSTVHKENIPMKQITPVGSITSSPTPKYEVDARESS